MRFEYNIRKWTRRQRVHFLETLLCLNCTGGSKNLSKQGKKPNQHSLLASPQPVVLMESSIYSSLKCVVFHDEKQNKVAFNVSWLRGKSATYYPHVGISKSLRYTDKIVQINKKKH